MSVTPGDVMQVLKDIETGEITLSLEDPDIVRSGWADIEYTASNGWKLVIFEYEYTWDYLDSVILPDGTTIDFSEDRIVNDPKWYSVRKYKPSREVARSIYRIPDYDEEELEKQMMEE